MASKLQAFSATVIAEVRLQHRQRSTWVLAALFLLVTSTSIDFQTIPFRSALVSALSTAESLGLLGSLSIAILLPFQLQREYKPSLDFFWQKHPDSAVFYFGKIIGTLLTVICALIPSFFLVGLPVALAHSASSLVLIVKTWLVVLLPTLFFVISVISLINLLMRKPLPAVLSGTLLVAVFLFMNLDVTHLAGFASYGIYSSALLGFGPDKPYVFWHDAFYVLLSILLLLLGAALSRRTAPRLESKPSVTSRLFYLGILLFLVGTVGWAARQFKSNTAALKPTYRELAPQPNPICRHANAIYADLSLQPKENQLEGSLTFTLKQPAVKERYILFLNGGLNVTQYQSIPKGVALIKSGNDLVLQLPPGETSDEWQITLEFSGKLHLPHDRYDNLFISPQHVAAPFFPGAYLSDKTSFLMRDGDWNPLAECAMDSLTVRFPLPKGSHLMHTASEVSAQGDLTVLQWKKLPSTLLFLYSPELEQRQILDSTLFTGRQEISNSVAEKVYSPHAYLIPEIDKKMRTAAPANGSLKIVSVPLLKNDYYDPASKLYFVARNYDAELTFKSKSKADSVYTLNNYQYRVARTVLASWWCSQEPCWQAQVDPGRLFNLSAEGDNSNHVIQALLAYSSLRLAEPLTGTAYTEDTLRKLNPDGAPASVTELPPVNLNTGTKLLVRELHEFWMSVGDETYWQMVRQYHTDYGVQSISPDALQAFLLQFRGERP